MWPGAMVSTRGSSRKGALIQENPQEQAMYRELFEEVGLSRKDVRILASTRKLAALQVA
ncbi:adenosine (5')-pentaphospho-(5'')-adenosine pyrophosphohydrolase [Klebsiella pneumoniae]|uniref:Adenosine (5')-pentaphospho-(5'')-adenosine pyrophosphohydrolase n=1 Tax=Klebsiella pneumoniae TaxID=573 RepID=A0A2X3CPU8_KLEPN|nr:adenosine (5')-pentaphospho-(5'')-adenosine pyrophosphohydrolase [Klebsiella pneumoniae]